MFQNVIDGLIPDIAKRLSTRETLISFGLAYLDDALVGIAPDDLILLGARSGAGKTQLCVNIARNALRQGKKCHFFALEADRHEITRRIKFETFQKLYKAKHGRACDFQRWSLGLYLPHESDLEAKANDIFAKEFGAGDLQVYYKRGDFTAAKMVEEVLKISSKTDLIIIDHIHYFDLHDDNENRAVKEIAKTARDLVLEQGKPIILVSHLRKANKENNYYAPTLEEFHGSSDLYKIATRAITLGPGDFNPESGVAETFVHIAKNRFDGSVNRYTGRVAYNIERGCYEQKYEVGSCYQKRDREFETLVGNDRPRFARRGLMRVDSSNDQRPKEIPVIKRGAGPISNLPYKD